MTKSEFCKNNGFNPETGISYVAIGNTYSVKDILKNSGFKYSKLLNWHGPKEKDIEDIDYIQVEFDKIFTNDNGYFEERIDARLYIENIKCEKKNSSSVYIGSIGEKITSEAIVTHIAETEGYYGTTYIYSFEDLDGNKMTWFSSVNKELKEDMLVTVVGTVKKLDMYQGDRITVLTRCKIK